jgi:lipopolysaccharide/colanic/teichoic acid biosynthesis glycosyltransferase
MSVVELRRPAGGAREGGLPSGIPFPEAPARPGWYAPAKRALDVSLALALLLATAPVVLLAMLGIVIVSGGSPIYGHERVGRGGRTFRMFKLRTMVRDAHAMLPELRRFNEADGPVFKMRADPRLHGLGAFLRRTSIDELPQLWNIVRGDMTLVGPRPERPYFVERFSAQVPRYVHRHRVRAGLTGFAQVSGLRGDTPIVDRARFDNYYIENWSLWMDFKVMIRTLGEILTGGGR